MGKYENRRRSSRKEDDELDKAYRKMSGNKGKGRKKSNVKHSATVTVILVALIAVIIFLAASYLYLENANLNGVIINNVYVAGVNVGGMTQAEAIDAVRAATLDTYSKIPMKVKVREREATIPVSCVGEFNIRKAVREAYKYGNTGPAKKKENEQLIALSKGYHVDITPYLNLDTAKIKEILWDIGSNYSTTLTQPSYTVTGEKPKQILTIKLGVPEYGLDLDTLYKQVMTAYIQNKFEAEGYCGMIEPDPIDIDAIHKEYYVAPINASFDSESKKVIDGKNGYGFDLATAKKKISEAKAGATIEIVLQVLSPDIDAKTLTSRLYKDILATYTASADSNADRNTNLRLACEAVNGTILYPGDIFSYNDVLGKRTAEKGYKPGPIYKGDETVMGIGGGICQVSSAIYYCAMMSDLEILMRKNHGFAASYVPLGMDSTISWGSIDFRFQNNSAYPIRIEATAKDGDTTITFYGTDLKDYYVKMEYDVLNTESYALSYKAYPADNPEGYKNGDYIVEPYTGYEVKTYRCKYSKETDALLSKELEASSKYRKRDGIICQILGSAQVVPSTPPQGIGNGTVTDGDGALPPE